MVRISLDADHLLYAGADDMITIIALMCHAIAGFPELCHEEIVVRAPISLVACQMGSQSAVADWKENSKFQGKKWSIKKILCSPGNYEPKDRI